MVFNFVLVVLSELVMVCEARNQFYSIRSSSSSSLPKNLLSPSPQPAIRLLSSPAHLLFQLIKLTTLPYLIAQLISNQSSPSSSDSNPNPSQSSSSSSNSSSTSTINKPHHHLYSPFQPLQRAFIHSSSSFNLHPSPSLILRSSPSILSHHLPSVHSRLQTTAIIHAILRQADEPDVNQLTQLLTRLDRPSSITLNLALLRLRPSLLAARLNPPPPPSPYAIARSWQAEAMARIVQAWSQPVLNSSPALDDRTRRRRIRRLRHARRADFLARGPSICACLQASSRHMPAAPDDVLFAYFLAHAHLLSPLARARLIDICLHRRRWDAATSLMYVITPKPSRSEPRLREGLIHKSRGGGQKKTVGKHRIPEAEARLQSRRLRQTTGLLLHLRDTTEPLENAISLQRSVRMICKSLHEAPNGHAGLRLNRLSLDVICRFARQLPNGSQARFTRRVCREFLRELEGKITTQPRWCRLRLLDHLAQQHHSRERFSRVLASCLSTHGCPKLARTILKAGQLVDARAGPPALEALVHAHDPGDLRPLLDYLLSPRPPPAAAVRQSLKLATNDDKLASHVLRRLSRYPIAHDLMESFAHRLPLAHWPAHAIRAFVETVSHPAALASLVYQWLKLNRREKENEERAVWIAVGQKLRDSGHEALLRELCRLAEEMGGREEWIARMKPMGMKVDVEYERSCERRRLGGVRLKKVKKIWADRVAEAEVKMV